MLHPRLEHVARLRGVGRKVVAPEEPREYDEHEVALEVLDPAVERGAARADLALVVERAPVVQDRLAQVLHRVAAVDHLGAKKRSMTSA